MTKTLVVDLVHRGESIKITSDGGESAPPVKVFAGVSYE